MRQVLHTSEHLAAQLRRILDLREGPAFRLALRMSRQPQAYLRAIERAETLSTETTRIIPREEEHL